MLRLGLCCTFLEEPIKFRTTTAAALLRLSVPDREAKLALICRENAKALLAALQFCAKKGIGCFRVNSQILPVKTHPEVGYELGQLPGGSGLVAAFHSCGAFAREHNLRLTFHPDQFVVLNSPRPGVVESSLQEIEYQAEVAEWIGADVINIHAGGGYQDKTMALETFARNVERLSDRARERLTVENDDRIYTPADLLSLCTVTGMPFVYDVHHHRCLPDGLTIPQATERALATWNREPLFHVSSPLEGWKGPQPHRHHGDINLRDFPAFWDDLDITVEVEAKCKERAIARLKQALRRRRGRRKSLPASGA